MEAKANMEQKETLYVTRGVFSGGRNSRCDTQGAVM